MIGARAPKVVIGVPVFNSERFLEPTLRSLLLQDYPNMEAVISDDASTDRTLDLVRRVVGDDPRFRLVRRLSRGGWVDNYNALLPYSSGDYFAWVPHDDLYDSRYVGTLVELLERRQDAVLGYSAAVYLDEDRDGSPGRVWTGAGHMNVTTTRLSRAVRYLWWTEWEKALPFRGLVRASALRATGGLKPLPFGPDNVWLFQLSLLGTFAYHPHPLCQKRLYRGSTVVKPPSGVTTSPPTGMSYGYPT
jgi:glycosyltransferase involved in cell wall biosynthesis